MPWPKISHILRIRRPMNFKLGKRMEHEDIFVLHPFINFKVHRPSDSEDMADFRSRHLSVRWPWPFDLWTCVQYHSWYGQPSCQLWCLLCDFSMSSCGKQTRVRLTTDVITLTLTSPNMSVMRFIVLRPCRLPSLKFVVRKPSCSEDMADFRSRHLSVSWPWPLIFWPLNGVTGHPCHGPPSCQWSACSGMGQTDDDHQRLMSRPMGAGIITYSTWSFSISNI